MAINKVVYGDQTLVDLTSDTATAEDVAQGKTFHDASGQLRTGSNTGGVVDVEVNGTSVVDPTTKIAEVTSYEEVTESKYEAIPVAERESNDIAYFIKDLNNPSVQGYPPLIYSDEEREIGVWRDGKPLYQKTFVFTGTYSGEQGNIEINMSIADTIFPVYSWGINGADAICPFPYVHTSANNNGGFFISPNKNSIGLRFAPGLTFKKVVITLQYTKTTDTAGSGIWNGQGGIAHHYSTDETVIGTWIDGKPLYEKTIDCGALPNSTTKNVEHSISDMGYAVAIQGSAINTNTGIRIPLPYVYGNARCLQIYIDSTHVKLIAAENMSIYTQSYITIQYTKTTD